VLLFQKVAVMENGAAAACNLHHLRQVKQAKLSHPASLIVPLCGQTWLLMSGCFYCIEVSLIVHADMALMLWLHVI
jgi:hypothetical protein